MKLSALPSVDELLRTDELARLSHATAVAAARETLAQARTELLAGLDPGDLGDLARRAHAAAARQSAPRLRRVVNATGVVLHTNLGRAPLAPAALDRVREVAAGYSNLEYDLENGARGFRHDHLAAHLRRLTGAEDALVVNNNAAAMLLALVALAEGREVIVSRGELVEIGDGFRIPDILVRSGARLREVGTTNRTRATDYEAAIGPDTAAILRVHQSNFRMVGFAERPSLAELAGIARAAELPLVDDLGSGCLVELEDEPLASDSIAAGSDLVSFSGDKLLGGPQAGIVCGSASLVAKLRRHPLQRALRPDKLTLAALEGTLLLYADRERAHEEIPAQRMLREPLGAVRARAERLAELVAGDVVESVSRAGGGALPLSSVPSAAVELELELAERLRGAEPPVIALVRGGRTVLDCRTIADGEVEPVAAAVRACR
jgi:L-seryl-tRNA(Ser) seleniumtransferase